MTEPVAQSSAEAPSEPIGCTHLESYGQAVEKWSNYSFVWYNSSAYFRAYVCMNVRYEATKEACESAEAQLIFFLGIFGFIGALLSTLTFFRRPFVPCDVYLYRLVGGIETVHMFIMTLMHALAYYVDCSVYYACMLFSAHVYMTVTNGCADAVEFVVVFLCVERTIACLTPQHFHRIHRLPAYRAVAILALLSALPLNVVHSFDVRVVQSGSGAEDQDSSAERVGGEGRYQEAASSFAETWFYARIMDAQLVRFCVVAPLIIISTAGSIIGLTQAARRKRRLRGEGLKTPGGRKADKSNDYYSKSADRSRKEIKQMIDLCCLQLCLAIPIVINYLLCLVERACKTGVIDRSKLWEDAFRTMTYEQALSILSRATTLEYLRFAISVTHMLAHGLHFYLYLLFSAKFRQTFARWLVVRQFLRFSRRARHREGIVSEGLTDYERVPMGVGYSTYEPTVNQTTIGTDRA